MKQKKSRSLRKRIDKNCRDCIYDESARGTWRQQVTLCKVESCSFHDIRPITKAPIPDVVLDYYMVTGAERVFYRLSRHPEGHFTKHNEGKERPSKGCLHVGVEKGPNSGDGQ